MYSPASLDAEASPVRLKLQDLDSSNLIFSYTAVSYKITY